MSICLTNYKMVITFADKTQKVLDVQAAQKLKLPPGAVLTLVDAATGKPPAKLVTKRLPGRLVFEIEGEGVVTHVLDSDSASAQVDNQVVLGSAIQQDIKAASSAVTEVCAPAAPTAAPELMAVGSSVFLGASTLGAIVGASVLLSAKSGPSASSVVARVVGGPVLAGNDLQATVYKADGISELGKGNIGADGTVKVSVGNYTGVVVVKVQNNGGPSDPDNISDYMDEATAQGKDLGNAVLYSIGEVVLEGSVVFLNVNILTSLAKLKATEAAAPETPLDALTVKNTTSAIASAFGLNDLTGANIETTITQTGQNSAQSANLYGEILAALSGADALRGGDAQQTIDELMQNISVDGTRATLSPAALTLLIEGAKTADPTNTLNLVGKLSNATALSSPTISINVVAGQNDVNASEAQAGVTVTGTCVAGAAVTLAVGSNNRNATVTGSTWSYTLSTTDITAMGQGAEILVATATLNGATTSASRGIYLDTVAPAAPTVTALLSNDTTPVISGHSTFSSSGERLSVSVNGATYALTPDNTGSWVLDLATATPISGSLGALVNGQTYQVVATVTDASGNATSDTSTNELVIDTSAPSLSIDAVSGGFINNAEDESVITVSGTSNAEDGRVVTLILGGQSYTATVNAGGWSVPVSSTALKALNAGTITLTANVTDAAGNTALQATQNFVYDITAPATPATPSAYSDDVGTLRSATSTAATTDDSQPALRVPVNLVDIPTLFINGVAGAATYDASAGTLTPNSNLPDGSYALTYSLTDAAGNQSARGEALNLTVDTTAPTTAVPTAYLDDAGAIQDAFSTAITTDDLRPGLRISANLTDTPKLYVDGVLVASSYDASTGTLTPSTNLAEGVHAITYTLTDAAGNESARSAPLNLTIDTIVPDTPSAAADLPATSDLGSSNTDNITNITRPGLQVGTLPAGVTQIDLLIDGQVVPAVYDVQTGLLQPSLDLSDGPHTVSYRYTDAAGNQSSVSPTLNLTIDTTAPVRPSTTADLLSSNDTGNSNSDDNTSNSRPVLQVGTLPDGVTGIELLVGGQKVAATYDSLTGQIRPDSALTDGLLAVTYRFLDLAGNASQASDPLSLTVDTTAPLNVAITTAAAGGIIGTFEPGTTLSLAIAGQAVTGTIVTNGNGTWQYVPSGPELTVLRVAGTKELLLTASDTAGNTATSSKTVTEYDFAGPYIKEFIPADTGVIANSVNGTATLNLVFSKEVVRGTGDIQLFEVGDPSTTPPTPPALVATIGVTTDSVVIRDGNDVFITLPGLTIGRQYYVTLAAGTFVDLAGEAFAGQLTAGTSGWDFSAAAASIAPNFVAGDDLINAAENSGVVLITGTVVSSAAVLEDITPSNLAVSVVVPAGLPSITATMVSYTSTGINAGQFVFSVPVSAWREGTYGYTVNLVGTAGDANNIRASYVFNTLGVDLTAPSITASLLGAQDNVGSITGDVWGTSSTAVSDDTSPTLTGTLNAALSGDARVVVYRQDVTNPSSLGALVRITTSEGLKPAGTTWSLTDSGLSDGKSYKYLAYVEDAAGNRSPAGIFKTLSVDTVAPLAAISGVSLSNDTGVSATDGITNVANQTLTGTLSQALGNGEKLLASFNGGLSWLDITGSVRSTDLSLSGVTLPAGSGSVWLQSADAAGNLGTRTTFAFTLDTTPPAAPLSAPDLQATEDKGTSDSDDLTNVNRPALLVGALPAGVSGVELLVNGQRIAAVYDGNTGTLQPTQALTNGSQSLSYRYTDAAGNQSGASAALGLTIDTTAPTSIQGVSLSADTGTSSTDGITSIAAQTISATLGAPLVGGEKVFGSLNNGNTWTEITSSVSGSAISWTGVTLAGSNTLQLQVRDAAGNAGTVATKAYSLDTTAPSQPTITPGSLVIDGANNRMQLAGTAEPDSVIRLVLGGATFEVVADNAGLWSLDTRTARNPSGTLDIDQDGTYPATITARDAAGNLGAQTIQNIVVSLVPNITSIGITAATGARNNRLNAVDEVTITVTLSRAVQVDTTSGTPTVSIVIGTTTVNASYVSGSGTSALVFKYTIQSGQADADGISIPNNAISLNGGTITSETTNAILAHAAVSANSAYLVDTVSPLVAVQTASTQTVVSPAGGAIDLGAASIGSANEFVVTFASPDLDPAITNDYSVFVQKFNAAGNTTGNTLIKLEAVGVTDRFDSKPKVAALGSSGEFVLVFQGDEQATGAPVGWPSNTFDNSIFVQRFGSDGGAIGSMVKLEGGGFTYRHDTNPVVAAVGSQGKFVVVWEANEASYVPDPANPTFVGSIDVYAQLFNANGTVSGNPVALASPKAQGFDTEPTVVGFQSGAYAVGWIGQDSTSTNSASHSSVFVQKFNPDGSKHGNQIQLDGAVVGTRDVYLNLTQIGSSEEFVAVWEGYNGATSFFSGSSIYLQRFGSDGSKRGSTIALNGSAFDSASTPVSTVDTIPRVAKIGNSGDFAVAWFGTPNTQTNTSSRTNIFVQKFFNDGSAGSLVEIEAVGSTGGMDRDPQIASIGSFGEFVVVWAGQDPGLNSTGSPIGDDSIFVQRFNEDGTSNGSIIKLEAPNVTDQNDLKPLVTALGSTGEFVVTWNGKTTSNTSQVFTQKFNADGALAPAAISDPVFPEVPLSISLKSSEPGAAYLVATFVNVTSLEDILNTPNTLWKTATISAADASVSIDSSGLETGSYRLFTVDAAGNLSSPTIPLIEVIGTTRSSLILGTPGNDTLAGANAAEYIFGLAGSDSINGGAGNDVIVSGSGSRDNLTGGDGSDTFVFDFRNTADAGTLANTGLPIADRISDFVTGVDKIAVVGAPAGSVQNYAVLNGATYGSESLVMTAVRGLLDGTVKYVLVYNYTGSGSGALYFDSDGIDGGESVVNLDGVNVAAKFAHSDIVQYVLDVPSDQTVPTVRSVSINSAIGSKNGNLNAGDIVIVKVIMSESMTVSGTPTLTLDIGGTAVQAVYVMGNGTSQLFFQYTVQAGQTDTDGIAIPENSLTLNGGMIRDMAGNAATLTHPAVVNNTSYVVDTTAPTATAAVAEIQASGNASVSSSAVGSAYLVNSTINITSVADITTLSDALWNSVAITTANSSTNLPASGLDAGTYKVYTADNAGNLSAAAANTISVIDLTAPTASLQTSGILTDLDTAVVASSETGTAYLVNTSRLTVNNLASITSAADNIWNSVLISSPNTPTNIALTGLGAGPLGSAGTYKLFTADAAGNLSSPSTGSFFLNNPTQVVALSSVAAGTGGFAITGAAGFNVSSAGDFNGDGLDDVIIGGGSYDGMTPWGPDAFLTDIGRAYVVYGKTNATTVNLSSLGSNGFIINGASGVNRALTNMSGDRAGTSVSAAGDVNGDGLADLIVSAPGFGDVDSGRVYVLFGQTRTLSIELSALGNKGFTIDSTGYGAGIGAVVSSAGDVNGDGLTDLIVTKGTLYPAVEPSYSYVVFGKNTTASVSLESLGSNGFAVVGPAPYVMAGNTTITAISSVSSAGDVNGDGLADLIVGTSNRASSYVVFGQTGTTLINLGDLGSGSNTKGFGIFSGAQATGPSAVSGAGDVNGDGLADLIVSSIINGRSGAYVIFGKTNGESVGLIGLTNGFAINEANTNDGVGVSVSSAGDINGDGLADLLVGAPGFGSTLGRTYVIFGKSDNNSVELSRLGLSGIAIDGQSSNDSSGFSVSVAGDLNGDGLADLIVGSNTPSGLSHVIFGSTTGAFIRNTVDTFGTTGADSLNDSGIASTLVANDGNDALIATAASVLYGGRGDDVFTIDQAMITALQSRYGSGGNIKQLARIDGGSGMDTVILNGAGLVLDLTLIANQGASDPDLGSRIDRIEKIDITGTGDNTLRLNLYDLLGLGSANLFEANGHQQLMVKGNSGDTVEMMDKGSWIKLNAPVVLDGASYNVLDHATSSAMLYVSLAVTLDYQNGSGNWLG